MNTVSRHVSWFKAVQIMHRLLVRQLLTKGRLVALLAVGFAYLAFATLVVRSNASTSTDQELLRVAVELMANLGFTLVVPIVSLVFASAAFGDLNEDSTLVYIWLRPMDRMPVVLGAWFAAVTVSLPLSLLPLLLSTLFSYVDGSLVTSTLLAVLIVNLAYCAVFLFLGLLTKNAVVWGIGYILIWEGFVSQISELGGRIAIRGYARSTMQVITDVNLVNGQPSLVISILVPASMVLVALVLSTLRLRSLNVD